MQGHYHAGDNQHIPTFIQEKKLCHDLALFNYQSYTYILDSNNKSCRMTA